MRWCLVIRSDTRFCVAVTGSAARYGVFWWLLGGKRHCRSLEFHTWALRHNRRFLSHDAANTIACSIVGAETVDATSCVRLSYRNHPIDKGLFYDIKISHKLSEINVQLFIVIV